jgi:hypothetical protein
VNNMSDALIIGLSTAFATIMAVVVPQLVAYWQNRRKVVDDSDLSRVDLAKKYQDIANQQADENSELEGELRTKEEEKKGWMSKYEEVMQELKTMESRHDQEIEELKRSFDTQISQMKEENIQWREWAERLVYQLRSWNLTPVPFSVEDAKKSGLSLGDFGNTKVQP